MSRYPSVYNNGEDHDLGRWYSPLYVQGKCLNNSIVFSPVLSSSLPFIPFLLKHCKLFLQRTSVKQLKKICAPLPVRPTHTGCEAAYHGTKPKFKPRSPSFWTCTVILYYTGGRHIFLEKCFWLLILGLLMCIRWDPRSWRSSPARD